MKIMSQKDKERDSKKDEIQSIHVKEFLEIFLGS